PTPPPVPGPAVSPRGTTPVIAAAEQEEALSAARCVGALREVSGGGSHGGHNRRHSIYQGPIVSRGTRDCHIRRCSDDVSQVSHTKVVDGRTRARRGDGSGSSGPAGGKAV